MISITAKQGNKKVAQKLKQLENRLKDEILTQAIIKMSNFAVKRARLLAPKKTGRLEQSLEVKQPQVLRNGIVRGGGVASDLKYAGIVHDLLPPFGSTFKLGPRTEAKPSQREGIAGGGYIFRVFQNDQNVKRMIRILQDNTREALKKLKK